jgi:hypothetical protein
MGPPETPDPMRAMKKTGKRTVGIRNIPSFFDSTPKQDQCSEGKNNERVNQTQEQKNISPKGSNQSIGINPNNSDEGF